MIILYASSAIDKIFGNGFIGMDKRRLLNWIHKTAAWPVRCCLVSNSMNVKINIKNNKNMKATRPRELCFQKRRNIKNDDAEAFA